MNFLNHLPFLRILFPFTAGIAVWLSGKQEAPHLVFLTSLYLFCLLVYFLTVKRVKDISKLIFGIALQVFLFIAGWLLCQLNNEKGNPQHYTRVALQETGCFAGYINEIPIEKSKSIKAEITLQHAKVNDEWQPVNGKIIVYFEKTELAKKIETGEFLVFSGSLKEVVPPLNPHEFDYKNYLALKNVYCTAYLKENNWKICHANPSLSLFTFAQKIRKRLLNNYRESGLQESEFALVAALVLGYDDEIDRPLMNAYSHTGTLHVLSVSGLHVGIIYVLLGYILSFLDNKNKRLTWLKVILTLGFLWFFVLLSGFSAPAVRTALMFSLILIGKTLFENVETANIVFVSAFVSLCYNPFWLASVGFQLSYTAVLGIIYLYPYFYNTFTFSSVIAEKTWALCAVSMAAQLSTMPITLYYFHQFPILFLVTNLVLIPVSTFVMYGGILVLVFSKVAFISSSLVWLTAILIKFMNGYALFFDRLPFCVIDNIHLSLINVLLFYVLVVIIFIAIEYRSTKLLTGSFVLILFMLLISIFLDFGAKRNNDLVIYHSDKSEVMGIFTGNKYTQISDSVDDKLLSTLREGKIHNDAIFEEGKTLHNASLILSGRKKILFLKTPDLIEEKLISAVKPDFIWVMARFLKRKKLPPFLCQMQNLIVSGSTSDKKPLDCINTRWITGKKGAFIVSLANGHKDRK